MTDDLKPMPDVIWAGPSRDTDHAEFCAGEWTNSPSYGSWAKVKYIRADSIPAPEKFQPTERDLTTAYMAGQMSNAPEKIDGVQEAYDNFGYRPGYSYEYRDVIKRALIQAAAKE